jgi:hypothetical protein
MGNIPIILRNFGEWAEDARFEYPNSYISAVLSEVAEPGVGINTHKLADTLAGVPEATLTEWGGERGLNFHREFITYLRRQSPADLILFEW